MLFRGRRRGRLFFLSEMEEAMMLFLRRR